MNVHIPVSVGQGVTLEVAKKVCVSDVVAVYGGFKEDSGVVVKKVKNVPEEPKVYMSVVSGGEEEEGDGLVCTADQCIMVWKKTGSYWVAARDIIKKMQEKENEPVTAVWSTDFPVGMPDEADVRNGAHIDDDPGRPEWVCREIMCAVWTHIDVDYMYDVSFMPEGEERMYVANGFVLN